MASIYNGKTPQPFCVADSDLRDVWVYVAGAIGIARHAEVVDCIECLATEKEGDTLIVMLTRDLSRTVLLPAKPRLAAPKMPTRT